MTTITVRKDVLSKAINTAIKAVSANPVTPLLGNLLFESHNGASRVAGTNFEVGISCSFPSDNGKEFKTCAPARTFAGLIDVIGSDEIDMELNPANQSVTIMTDSSTSNIKCMPAEEFPDIPKVTEPNLSLPVAQFKEMIQRVAFASNDKSDSTLSGVLLTTEMVKSVEKLIMFATDGLHLSYEETSNLGLQGEAFYVIIKGSTLDTVSRILPEEGELEIEVNENKILFHCVDVDVVAQLMTGKFPDYKLLANAIPATTTTVITPTLELLRACRQLKIFSAETGSSKMEIQGMLIRYSSLAMEKGDSDINLFGAKKGEDITVGINVHFLQDFLEICKTDNVVIELAGTKAPIVFRMQDFQEYYHVIMPINFG